MTGRELLDALRKIDDEEGSLAHDVVFRTPDGIEYDVDAVEISKLGFHVIKLTAEID